MIVFVRNPAERHVSMWRYIHRNNEMSGYIYNQEWRLALSFDLADFMALPNPVELHRYLDVPLHRFSFVGAMSDFDADVERLCAWLSIDYEPVCANTAPTPTVVSTEMRDAYERANSEEMDLYYAALQRREVLCR